MEEKTNTKPKKVIVTAQLPTQEIRNGVSEAGDSFEFVTIEESLSEMLSVIRRLERNLLKGQD